jgi:hypothetical protein
MISYFFRIAQTPDIPTDKVEGRKVTTHNENLINSQGVVLSITYRQTN